MEDNNEKKGKRGVVNASVVLSFAVAIFAIFSLAMAGLSMTQKTGVSYAAPTALPNSFTFNLRDGGRDIYGTDANSTGQSFFNVPMYVADNDNDNPIFCVEHPATTNNGESYSVGDDIEDYGLLYLLNNSFANDVHVTNVTGENSVYVESWVTQVAIWMYLYETDPTATQATSKNYISPEDINIIKNVNKLTVYNSNHTVDIEVYEGEKLYPKYVKPLVDKAKLATDVAYLTVSKASDDISISEDKKFYYSSLITVIGDPSDSLKRYTVSLTGIDGAKVVDENFEELGSPIARGTKFYVRIPADKVTKEVQKVVITVDGVFGTLEGKYYNAAGAYQKVVSVKAGEKVISKGTEVEFVGTDDTGMTTVQTIYFIGLIVLLCGIGIVYANAKPVQVKQ